MFFGYGCLVVVKVVDDDGLCIVFFYIGLYVFGEFVWREFGGIDLKDC